MVDVSSTVKTGTASGTSSTSSLRNVLNAISSYRGTAYYYIQRKILDLVAECLEELGFGVEKNNSTNYYNHIIFKDYSDDVCCQFHSSGTSNCYLSFLYPRHISNSQSFGSLFNNNTSCYATIRMLGQGPGKTKTLLILRGNSVPGLNEYNCIYFTEAKNLLTGEMKKAIVIQQDSSYLFYIFDEDWSFLPGMDSELTTAVSISSYSSYLTLSQGYRMYMDPYTSYKIFQEQNFFPEIPVTSPNGVWEFPDLIINPYGWIGESETSEKLKYSLTSGNIYQIGNKKYLCNYSGDSYLLYRLE